MSEILPCSFFWGKNDRFTVFQNLQKLHKFAKNIVTHIFPDATHWLTHEKEAEIIPIMRKFLAKYDKN